MSWVHLVCFVALVAGSLADGTVQVDKTFLQHQKDILDLFYHIHEPICHKEHEQIAKTWSIEKNLEHFTNVTAVKIYIELYENGLLPRGVPFTILEGSHRFEAITLFNMLYSAKDFTTFYHTALWARYNVNEFLFVHVFTAAILHRHDTQGMVVPPIYEIFPSFFNNGEIMATAQRFNTHGHDWIEHYPHTYVKDNDIIIQANYTYWPYYDSQEVLVHYLTHDHGLNAWYHNTFMAYPFWLGADVVPLIKDKRGEWFWFIHKQLVTRYYMERLSNGLSEIEELSLVHHVDEGYISGLVYPNGMPFPVRHNHMDLSHHHEHTQHLIDIHDYEHRIRDAIDQGYIVNLAGEHISLRTPEAIDLIGRLIESNVDSPNTQYYRDFISLWKTVLSNSIWHHNDHHEVNLVVPGILEHHYTTLRDPAFYMLWKRVLSIFDKYHHHMPLYKREELALPSVTIKSVEVGKLQTYFEKSFINVTNFLHLDHYEVEHGVDTVAVMVERPRLNHKVFKVEMNVACETAKAVVVRFFLAPKYDSHGHELPLHENYENFFQLDQFVTELKEGDNTITRDSTDNKWAVDDWMSTHELYTKVADGKLRLENVPKFDGFPDRLLLPKGRIGGMPFLFMVYISEFKAPKVPFGTGFDPATTLGLGTGARLHADDPLGFPLDRPLHNWQIHQMYNVHLKEVTISHKPTDVHVTHLD